MKNKKIKLALISLGSIIAIGSPIIIMSSIFAFKNNKTPIEQTNLIDFYNREAGSLFQKSNFQISAPILENGQYVAKNVTKNNINFLNRNELKNYSYDLEIVEIIPNNEEGLVKFRYKIFLIHDESISITEESEEYNGFIDELGKHIPFFK